MKIEEYLTIKNKVKTAFMTKHGIRVSNLPVVYFKNRTTEYVHRLIKSTYQVERVLLLITEDKG